jgi:hypothetical protein
MNTQHTLTSVDTRSVSDGLLRVSCIAGLDVSSWLEVVVTASEPQTCSCAALAC